MAAPPVAGAHGYRAQRWRARLGRSRRMWRIYYRSTYGKVGFWILMGYVVITLLSPILTFHDPLYFFAPQEDAYGVSQELGLHLGFSAVSNGTPLAPAADSLTATGSPVVYVTGANGTVFAVGLGASSSTAAGSVRAVFSPEFPAGSEVFPASVVPLANVSEFLSSYSTFGYSEYVLVGATGGGTSEIAFAQIRWSGTNGPGDGTPRAVGVERLTINGTLVGPPVTSSLPLTPPPSWGPFADSSAYTVDGLKAAYIYTVTRSNGSYDLSGYYAVPLQHLWTERLPYSDAPSAPLYVGSYFAPPDGTSSTQVLITQGPSVLSYDPSNGAIRWRTNLTGPVDPIIGPIVPIDYQITRLNTSDNLFVAVEGSEPTVARIGLGGGAAVNVTRVPAPIEGLSTTPGDSGYPSTIAILTAHTAYFLSGPDAIASPANALSLPSTFGPSAFDPIYDPNSNLMILTDSVGSSDAVLPTLGATPYQWGVLLSPAPSSISAPILLVNALTGRTSIAFVTSSSQLDVFATIGIPQDPLPPSLHEPSGNVYLFGTNSYGQDVWSQWVASFPVDWEVGLAVAAGIMGIAVIVAMFIGYVGGWLATAVETVSLVLFLLPGLALLIVVASILGASFLNIVAVLTLVGWPFTAFTLIGVVRSVRSRTFIEAAKVSGAGTLQILRRHMLPNMTPLLAYLTALSIGGAVTALSTLQFLGVAPLTLETWGGMLQPMLANYFLAIRAPWWIWPPTIALTMFVFAFVFVSRGLDEVVNPRIRSR